MEDSSDLIKSILLVRITETFKNVLPCPQEAIKFLLLAWPYADSDHVECHVGAPLDTQARTAGMSSDWELRCHA